MTPKSIVLHAGSIVFNGTMLDFIPWMFLWETYILLDYFELSEVLAAVEKEKSDSHSYGACTDFRNA